MTPRTLTLAALALPLAALSAVASAADMTVIDFDDVLTSGSTTWIDPDHYAGQGVLFSAPLAISDLTTVSGAASSEYLLLGGSAPNGLLLTGQHGLSFDMSVHVPGSMAAATTDFISVLFYDTNIGTSLGTLEAYDASGAFLGSVTAATPIERGLALTLSIPGMHMIRISTDGDGAVADNIMFLSVPEVPAPASLALLSFAGLGARRRRRRSCRQ